MASPDSRVSPLHGIEITQALSGLGTDGGPEWSVVELVLPRLANVAVVGAMVAAIVATLVLVSAHNVTHNAGSQRSRNSLNSRRSPPDAVFGRVHKHKILWLTSLTKAS